MKDEVKMIPIDRIRILNPRHRDPKRFQVIVQSIRNLGLKKPIQVSLRSVKDGEEPGYDLVCGQGRIEAFLGLGHREIPAIVVEVPKEERLLRSLVENMARRVPPPLAAALNLDIRDVKSSMSLLDGINEGAVDLLTDKGVCSAVIRLLKRVTAIRQIEVAELMVTANNYTKGYAEALILATPRDLLTNPEEPKKRKGLSAEDIARMEEELETLERDLRSVDESYGENMLNLTVARGYIRRLLDNARVLRFLKANHAEILAEFEVIARAESL